ncbi:MAG: HIRAN domain-containing protein [Lachnospiraceae bacterium]|nr:HIRAN domain-containing protein [Lachnospiraceae bacterium]
MKEKYITVTGIKHYYGLAPFKIGKKLKCVKEPHNPYDSEAIRVTLKHVGTVGYVANSSYTTLTGTMSTGRIYEKVGKKFKAEVMFITPAWVICRVVEEEKQEKQEVAVDEE